MEIQIQSKIQSIYKHFQQKRFYEEPQDVILNWDDMFLLMGKQ